ncbi:Protein nervous wreck [Trichinella spiralis]|uniref:Protein nervous wreck n=1 Tax=Trichinella spiralis TaxID=6334 RepID=A0ABR3KR63_TRISP
MVRVKTDSRVKKYLFAFSFGCAIKGFSISFANIERLLEETDVKVPVSHCLKPVPNVLLNMFSLWLTTLSLFFMAVDRLVAIRSIKLSTTAKLKLRSHRFLIAVISLSILNSVAILADCIKRIGYSTVLIYGYAMVLLKRNVVSASDSIRISQIRREETLTISIYPFMQLIPLHLMQNCIARTIPLRRRPSGIFFEARAVTNVETSGFYLLSKFSYKIYCLFVCCSVYRKLGWLNRNGFEKQR